MITVTNVCFAVGHDNGDRLGNQGGHGPTMEIISVFQRMNDKVKDGLVLSVD